METDFIYFPETRHEYSIVEFLEQHCDCIINDVQFDYMLDAATEVSSEMEAINV